MRKGEQTRQGILETALAEASMAGLSGLSIGGLASKQAELAPYVERALSRKQWMQPIADEDIPVVKASVARAQTSGRV